MEDGAAPVHVLGHAQRNFYELPPPEYKNCTRGQIAE
jgi:hypothetical protein